MKSSSESLPYGNDFPKTHHDIASVYKNISVLLSILSESAENSKVNVSTDLPQDDPTNAWLYILFVLMFYAFSIVVLMIKYIRRERESAKLEYYYNEFVKREWYKDKNVYDLFGRRIKFNGDGRPNVTKITYYEDPDEYFDCDENLSEKTPWLLGSGSSSESNDGGNCKKKRKSVLVCAGAATIMAESAAIGLAPLNHLELPKKHEPPSLNAMPKRSSMKRASLSNATESSVADRIRRDSLHIGWHGKAIRRNSTLEDFETMPLAYLHDSNKLMFAKVDEGVRRVHSLPPVKGARAKRVIPRIFSDDSQDSIGNPVIVEDKSKGS